MEIYYCKFCTVLAEGLLQINMSNLTPWLFLQISFALFFYLGWEGQGQRSLQHVVLTTKHFESK